MINSVSPSTLKQLKETSELGDVKVWGEIAGLSPSTVWRLNDSGKIPAPVRIGRSVRWRLSDIRDWIEWDCPNRKKFNILKSQASKRGGA